MRFPLPPRKLELQRLLYPAGRPIYKDVDGVNELDKYYMPDNVEGRKLRPIQPGRGYNFTGVEILNTPSLNSPEYDNIFEFECLFKLDTSPSSTFSILTQITNGWDILIRDSGVSNIEFIGLSSSTVFSNLIPVVGTLYHLYVIKSGSNLEIFINGTLDSTHAFVAVTSVGTRDVGIGNYSLTSDASNRRMIGGIYFASLKINTHTLYYNLDESSGLIAYDSSGNGNNGVINLGESPESSFHTTDPEVPSRQNEVGYWFSGDAVGVGALTPIALDGNGKTDVLGNTVPHPYFGEVRKEALLTNASCMNFDGNLVLTFSDLSSRSIVDQEGDVTLEISGNNIQPVSGTGVVWYLEFDNGSYYRGSEVNGLTVWDLNTSNALDGIWDLLGSSDGDQYGDSEFARPNNLLDGFTKAGYFKIGSTGEIDNGLNILPTNYIITTNFIAYNTIFDIFWSDIADVGNTQLGIFQFNGTVYINFYGNLIGLGVSNLDDNTQHEIIIKLYSTTLIAIVDEVEKYNQTIVRGAEIDTGAQFGQLGANRGNVAITKIRIDETDSSGNITNDHFNLDIINGDSASIKNIANNAQLNSDMQWVTDGTYQLIPADPASKGFNVTGGVLGVKGSTIAMNPCESKVIFNPYGDPGLHAMGLTDTIELGYVDIVADESLFHDNRVANKIEKLLAYSDFQYPIAGSAAYFDGNITVAVTIAKDDTDFIHQTGIFSITLYASFDNGASITDVDVLLGTINSTGGVTSGFNVYYGNSVAGVEGKISLRYAFNAFTITLSTEDLSNVLEDGKLHKIKFISTDTQFTIEIDNIVKFNLGDSLPIFNGTSDFSLRICEDDNYVHRGMIAQIQIVNDSGDEIVFYPSAEEEGLTWFNAGLNRLASSNVTVSLNGSSDGDQFVQDGNLSYHHNLQYGYHDDGTSLVPGDPNNFRFDVNNDPIDNLPKVIKKRRIRQFLRK